MQSGKQEPLLNVTQKVIIISFLIFSITFLAVFRNTLFKPTLLLKNLGKISIDPEIAFTNNKPTFLEFYAEWCEVCKEMAPKVAALQEEYNSDINFVFLNVDNLMWDKYIRKFNVNGIPQLNLFNNKGDLEFTLVGKQERTTIEKSLENLRKGLSSNQEISNTEFSIIKEKTYKVNPRSHS